MPNDPLLENDPVASGKRVEELRAGRNLGDIPLGDPYWQADAHHKRAHGMKLTRDGLPKIEIVNSIEEAILAIDKNLQEEADKLLNEL